MRKIKLKVPAKINLTLDVTGERAGYHLIKSLVSSVDVYDEITVTARKDSAITLSETGIKTGCSVVDNSAFKAAKLFTETFSTDGADIRINKNIPVGGGMGGSSADIAGVLKAMNALYGGNFNVLPLANHLGSDSGYMLGGGFAVISDRGTVVSPLNVRQTLYILLITETDMISARECYKAFDALGEKYAACTDKAVERLLAGDLEGMCGACKNDLGAAASGFIPRLKDNAAALLQTGAMYAGITGSGSVTFGIFGGKKIRDEGFKKLFPAFGGRLIKAQTL